MKRFIEGEDRTQVTLLPACLDDYVEAENPVRVVEVFVDGLDLGELGFVGVDPAATGRPAYHPAVLLKLYIYGYLNRIHSSRRLEREAQRNIELMWLTGRLMPDFKTIANFRKDNGPAIRKVCRQFIVLCRQLNLFTEAIVAIDGSKFKAVNNRDKNFTPAKMQRRMAQIEESIARYLAAMDTADRAEPEVAELKKGHLREKIAALKERMSQLKIYEAQMLASADQQLSLTDPDARSMKSRDGGIVGYNVQTAVDAKHHLIVAHEVITAGIDREQLAPMAEQAREATGIDELTVVADRGYFKGEQVLQCDEAGITAILPKTLTSNSLCLALGAVPRSAYVRTGDHSSSRATLSQCTPHSAEGSVTFPLRQCSGRAVAAEPQARDTTPRCHASIRRASLGVQSVLASIRSRLW